MTDELELLDDTVRAILDRHCTREARAQAGDSVPARLWQVLDESGLTALGMPDGGGGLPELVVLARAVGRAAAPVPLVEMSGMASWLLAEAGLPLPEGITTCAVAHPRDNLQLSRHADGWTVSGSLHRVPWGAAAQQVVAMARPGEDWRVVVLTAPSRVERGRNHAGEPRDTLHYDGVLIASASAAVTALTTEDLLARGALLRAASMAGAMERVLEMTLDHAENREQFGRPLSAFQAVQHHLVAIAEESVCASMAVRAAAAVVGPEALLAVAAAKTTAGEGARIVAARSHQVHGAIGTTQEHALHWFTTRLWSWQDECGSARAWSRQIGQDVLRDDPQNLWARISASVHGAGQGASTASALAAQS